MLFVSICCSYARIYKDLNDLIKPYSIWIVSFVPSLDGCDFKMIRMYIEVKAAIENTTYLACLNAIHPHRIHRLLSIYSFPV